MKVIKAVLIVSPTAEGLAVDDNQQIQWIRDDEDTSGSLQSSAESKRSSQSEIPSITGVLDDFTGLFESSFQSRE